MKSILALCAVTILSACVTNNLAQQMPIGSQYQKAFNLGYHGAYTPLEEGNWTLAGLHTFSNNKNTQWTRAILLQTEGRTVTKIVKIDSPHQYGRHGYVRSKFCEREDIHFINKQANYAGREQDCWGINHFRMVITSKDPAYNQAVQYVKDNHLEVPKAMIGAQYRKANSFKFLNLTYYFNPETDGFKPPKTANWATSDWHPQIMYNNQEKAVYIEKIKAWADKWNVKVDQAFNG